MNERAFSSRVLRQFVETAAQEIGRERLLAVLEKAGLPSTWAATDPFEFRDGETAAGAYAGLQNAIRVYYGRGARGILFRVGGRMWQRLLDSASLSVKAQSALVRSLPVSARRKPALELLASMIVARKGDITVHTLDLDLLLVDHASPGTLGQNDVEPICFVTQGLIREAMQWAIGVEADITEAACRAQGENACEFKVVIGG